MSGLRLDLAYAVRRIRRSAGFALTATLTLAIGIGAATAVFSVVNGLFLRPLPGVADQDRLVMVEPSAASSVPTLEGLRRTTRTLEGLAGFLDQLVGVEAGTGAVRTLGLLVSEDYFRVLGTRPALGRLLGPGDDRAVVLGHRFWERSLDGDPDLVGRTLRVNGEPFTVAGVAPPGFVGAFAGFRFDVWLPLAAAPALGAGVDLEVRSEGRLELVGRRAPGASAEAVRSELESLAAGLATRDPELPRDFGLQVRPFTGFDDDLRAGTMALVGALLALALLLLLVAVANVSGMLLLRGLDRARETALRRILGGTAGRSARPLWIETALLSLGGGLLGLLLAARIASALEGAVPAFPVALAFDFGVDGRVAGFALGLSLLAALASGLGPTLRSGRSGGAEAPGRGTAGGRRTTRLRRIFVVCQVGLSAVLLVVAGLFVRSVRGATDLNRGFDVERVHVAPFVDLGLAGVTTERAPAVQREILRRVAAVPTVRAAAWTSDLPLEFRGTSTATVRVEGRVPPPGSGGFEVDLRAVSPGFFDALGIPLRRGRDFASVEGGSAPRMGEPPEGGSGQDAEPAEPAEADAPAIVGEALAGRLWPDREALGRRVELDGRRYRVVGVAADVRRAPARPGASPALYVPLLREGRRRAVLVVRSASPASAVGPAVRQAAREVAPDLPGIELQPLGSYLALSLLPQRLGAAAATALGGLGLLLSGIGLYGVLAYTVTRRRREIGVRVAVGARRLDVIRLTVREGAALTAAGIVAGGVLGVATGRILRGLLPGTPVADPVVLVVAGGALLAVGALAAALPARRALEVDPAAALRAE